MKLDPQKQAAAEAHMREMVGSAIGVVLLAADDFDTTQSNLLESVREFPVSMRDVSPETRTFLLQESTRNVRLHARGLYRLLGEIVEARAAEAGVTVEEAREAAMGALLPQAAITVVAATQRPGPGVTHAPRPWDEEAGE